MNGEFPRESNAVNSFGREEYEVRDVSTDSSGAKILHQWVLGDQEHTCLDLGATSH